MESELVPRSELENQLFLERALIPDLVLGQPRSLEVQAFVEDHLAKALHNNWYRVRYNMNNGTVYLERVTGENIRPDEQFPGDLSHQQRKDMLDVRTYYERLTSALYDYCTEAGESVPPPPAFREYELVALSGHTAIPDYIHEKRAELQQLIQWDELRKVPDWAYYVHELDHHVDELQRHYNRFFNTESTKDGIHTLYDWMHAIAPALHKVILKQRRAAA